MERQIVEKVINQIITHEFYCDECNEYLGASVEYDDGYYDSIGRFETSYYIGGEWFKLKKCLCDKCANELVNKIRENLFVLGFGR